MKFSRMEGVSRRSPEGERKALWKYANDQFDRKINDGVYPRLNLPGAGNFTSAKVHPPSLL